MRKVKFSKTLANEQELFHGGKLIDTKENNKLTLSFPLSTTFDYNTPKCQNNFF